jgi:hypothetical protein
MITRLFLLTRSELVALSIFVSYFVLILSLFALIVHSLWRKHNQQLKQQERRGTSVSLFSCLAIASFGFTWYCEHKYVLLNWLSLTNARHDRLSAGEHRDYRSSFSSTPGDPADYAFSGASGPLRLPIRAGVLSMNSTVCIGLSDGFKTRICSRRHGQSCAMVP